MRKTVDYEFVIDKLKYPAPARIPSPLPRESLRVVLIKVVINKVYYI